MVFWMHDITLLFEQLNYKQQIFIDYWIWVNKHSEDAKKCMVLSIVSASAEDSSVHIYDSIKFLQKLGKFAKSSQQHEE